MLQKFRAWTGGAAEKRAAPNGDNHKTSDNRAKSNKSDNYNHHVQTTQRDQQNPPKEDDPFVKEKSRRLKEEFGGDMGLTNEHLEEQLRKTLDRKTPQDDDSLMEECRRLREDFGGD